MPVDAFRPKVSSRGVVTRAPEGFAFYLCHLRSSVVAFAFAFAFRLCLSPLPFAFAFAFAFAFRFCLSLLSCPSFNPVNPDSDCLCVSFLLSYHYDTKNA